MQWNAQTLRWFEAASEYTHFHENLIDRMLLLMPTRNTVADLGCGAGLVDLSLSRHVKAITCVDQNQEVLTFLERAAAARGISNLHTRCADAFTLQGQWDSVIMLFFGRIAENPRAFLSLCNENVIAVVRADAYGHLGPKGYHPAKHNTVQKTAAQLDAQGIRYSLAEDALEYGQPLESHEEAETFVRAYSRGITEDALHAYLQEKLVKTGEEKYPLYLPNRKAFGIFCIRRDENA
ncbi:class I SAM-dependent methyltransferase [Eubacteriales bacterium OttesenSCG-928-A19]|nr:class I SAM-dependent methyltransferase [Eubacteriales bacterium OttesenSCG-928-A19]